jgi:hypothetical protein
MNSNGTEYDKVGLQPEVIVTCINQLNLGCKTADSSLLRISPLAFLFGVEGNRFTQTSIGQDALVDQIRLVIDQSPVLYDIEQPHDLNPECLSERTDELSFLAGTPQVFLQQRPDAIIPDTLSYFRDCKAGGILQVHQIGMTDLVIMA